MAHPEQKRFIATVARHLGRYFTNCRVLEIGSLDINGSVRDYFHKCKYIGIDVAEGKGVDMVCQGQEYAAPSDSFDQVISCEAMEHNPHWEATFRNMVRLCRPGGLVLMTCATIGRAEHGTTKTGAMDSPLTVKLGWEYYRNLLPEDFRRAIDLEANFSQYHFWTNRYSLDLYFCGIKTGVSDVPASRWQALLKEVEASTVSPIPRRYLRYQTVTANYLRNLSARKFHKFITFLKKLARPNRVPADQSGK